MTAIGPTIATTIDSWGFAVLLHEQSDFDEDLAGAEWCIGHVAWSPPWAHVHSVSADWWSSSTQTASGAAIRPAAWQQTQTVVSADRMRRTRLIRVPR